MGHAKKDMLSFFLTTDCNLNCIYCYTNKNKFDHQFVDIDFAKYAIDEYFREKDSRHIRFQGAGEPTTAFPLMKAIFDYAKLKAGDALVAELQTNGIFPRDTRKWLSENIDIIWVSCDGTPDIQNHNRPTLAGKDTAKDLEENIRFLLKNGKGMTGVRMTVSSKVLGRQIECLEYFKSLGVSHVWADPIFPVVGEVETFYPINEHEYLLEFIESVKFARKNNIYYGSILTCNFDEKVEYNCRACLPSPHLTTDGYVSACDMALFGKAKDHMDLFIYGRWDSKSKKIIYDYEKIKILQSRKVGNLPKCAGCIVEEHCAGYCPGEVVNETKGLFEKKSNACKMILFLSQNMESDMFQYKFLHP